MTDSLPGLTELSCCASLENHRSLPNKGQTVFFDGTIYSAQPVQDSHEILCCFRFFTPADERVPTDGYYEIKAKVNYPAYLLSRY